jgi:hypothetical protein
MGTGIAASGRSRGSLLAGAGAGVGVGAGDVVLSGSRNCGAVAGGASEGADHVADGVTIVGAGGGAQVGVEASIAAAAWLRLAPASPLASAAR